MKRLPTTFEEPLSSEDIVPLLVKLALPILILAAVVALILAGYDS